MEQILKTFIPVLLWLKIALSPTFVAGLIAVLICVARDTFSAPLVVAVMGVVLLTGAIWAERIRRTVGILAFHSRLISTPEIDGRKNSY
ncbi:hypothetical protein MD588_15740 [Photobacterium sp. SDRW27]|uniref:hypothetical protein n=1 Tax=Photobacterium obscurum TaxID=2829490 RepID=UPI002243F284|nr:hypothetical protein [Photobacterium obscurum]MCW8330261.1 hypothetical protein [Photobacterium obscurum]